MDWKVIDYESIDSTNLEARRLVEAGEGGPGLVVRARHQEAGRGRLQRSWWDLPGKSLLVSLVLDVTPGLEATRLACVATAAAIRREGKTGPRIKWPNDLVYGRKKVAGVLAEALPSGELTVVGAGINVNYLPGELIHPEATSLLIEERELWDPDRLLAALLEEVGLRLAGEAADWGREYTAGLAYLGEAVTVRPPFTVHGEARGRVEGLEGILQGVDASGFLLLSAEDTVYRVMAGDLCPGEGSA